MVVDIYKENFLKDKRVIIALSMVSCFLWGSAFPAIKVGYNFFHIHENDTYKKILFAGYRFFIAASIIMLALMLLKKKIKVSADEIKSLVFIGIVQTTLQYMFFYIGLSNTTGVKGSILSSGGTFFSVIIAHYIYKNDRLNLRKIFGLLFGFMGIIILNIRNTTGYGGFSIRGEGFLIFSCLLASIGSIYGKKISKSVPPVLLTGYQMLIGALFLIIVGRLGSGSFTLKFTTRGSILLLYMALISAVAVSIWTLLIKYNAVGKISIYQFAIPVFGTIISSIVLNENLLNINTLVALALVSIGVIIIT